MAPEAQQAFKSKLEKLLAEYSLAIEQITLSEVPFRTSILDDDERDSLHLVLLAVPKRN
jgi:hypothetical protein